VLSIRVDSEQTLQPDQRDLLDAFARQAALMLERQQLQAAEVESRQLAESERLGRALLNSISHEIRTPLAVITAAAAGLRSTPGLADTASTLAGEIHEATDRLNRLVRNLLNMARMEAGHVAPQWEWVDPVDVARTALRNCEPVMRNHAVEWKVANGLPLIRVDPVLIGQVLENLLVNAAVHASGGGPITLSGWVRDGQVALDVSDRGPGIPASDLERIFDKFWRARNAPAGGTGLGLSIARGFAEACGGRLTASARPGGGTTFSLQLPVQVAPVPPEAPIGAHGS
jgi:two-component system sensor histidine kinase KdpD